jgi:flavin-dependent dehydrogenase
MPDRFDASIIGGGPAGSTAAVVVACNGQRVVALGRVERIEAATAWQVLRSAFDQMLLDNAREFHGPITIDATGRDAFFEALLDAVATFAAVPQPLPHGQPCC